MVCKGYNDGDVLLRTLEDLFSFEESLLSIAVVPVGLTKYRKFPLNKWILSVPNGSVIKLNRSAVAICKRWIQETVSGR